MDACFCHQLCGAAAEGRAQAAWGRLGVVLAHRTTRPKPLISQGRRLRQNRRSGPPGRPLPSLGCAPALATTPLGRLPALAVRWLVARAGMWSGEAASPSQPTLELGVRHGCAPGARGAPRRATSSRYRDRWSIASARAARQRQSRQRAPLPPSAAARPGECGPAGSVAMGFSLYNILKFGVLIFNALAILHDKRVLAPSEGHERPPATPRAAPSADGSALPPPLREAECHCLALAPASGSSRPQWASPASRPRSQSKQTTPARTGSAKWASCWPTPGSFNVSRPSSRCCAGAAPAWDPAARAPILRAPSSGRAFPQHVFRLHACRASQGLW